MANTTHVKGTDLNRDSPSISSYYQGLPATINGKRFNPEGRRTASFTCFYFPLTPPKIPRVFKQEFHIWQFASASSRAGAPGARYLWNWRGVARYQL